MREANLVAAMCAVYLATIFGFAPEKEAFTARVAFVLAVLLLDLLIASALRFAHARRRSAPRYRWYWAAATGLASAAVLLQAAVLSGLWGLGSAQAKLLLIGVLSLLCAAHGVFFRRELQLPRPHAEPGPLPLLALVWLLVPLANYLIRNPAFVSLETGSLLLLALLLIPLAVLVALQRLQVRLWRRDLAVPLGVAFFYVFYSWPTLTAALEMPVEASILPHLLILAAVSALLVLLHAKAGKWFVPLAGLMLAVTVLDAALARDGEAASQAEAARRGPTSLASKPDIYFLVYDAYVGSDLLARFGLDNRDHEAFLERAGFTLYRRIYTVIGESIASIARVLHMSPSPGAKPDARAIIAGRSTVHGLLERMGYRTHYALNPYMTLDAPLLGDYHYPGVDEDETYGALTLLRGIAVGEFKFDLIYDVGFSYDDFVQAKREVIAMDPEEPKFLYAHSPRPGHSQNSGACLPDETQRFAARLEIANAEMQNDVAAILERGRDSIIAIAGDHGPYLSGDCHYLKGVDRSEITALHLSDRFGTFLAILWPKSVVRRHDDIRILQDVFFSIVATLTDEPEIFRRRLRRSTLPPFEDAIRDGIVSIGPDRGSPIY